MSKVGAIEFPRTDIVVNRPVALSNSTSILAGKIVLSGDYFGLLDHTVDTSGQLRGLVINNIMRVDKKAGGGLIIATGDAIKFTQVAGEDWYEVQKAGAGDTVHGYAMEAAGATSTDILIKGPLEPPFALFGEAAGDTIAAEILALLTGATAGQVLVADGANGVQLTSFAIPVADGGANEILKTDGAEAVTWQVDAT